MLGVHPIASYIFNNHTIAASLGGTANSTLLVSSISATHARFMRCYNTTPKHLELLFGSEQGTLGIGVMLPGQASEIGANAQPIDFSVPVDAGGTLRCRTLANAPVTMSETEFLHISLWD